VGGYQQLKDIEIYVLSRRLAERVWKAVEGWDYFAKKTVGEQLVRAVDSISANIAESYGRHHIGDVARFLYYARGSLYETQDWLSKAIQRGLLPKNLGHELLDEVKVIAPKLNAYISGKYRYTKTIQPPNNPTTKLERRP